jgi:hypothetical protein
MLLRRISRGKPVTRNTLEECQIKWTVMSFTKSHERLLLRQGGLQNPVNLLCLKVDMTNSVLCTVFLIIFLFVFILFPLFLMF